MKLSSLTLAGAFALAACSSDPLCDATELQAALGAASAGDTVRVGNCRIAAAVTVPAGVRLEGMGTSASSLMGPAGSATVRLEPGTSPAELASITVESAGPIGILARGAGQVRITDADVRASLGVGVGIEDVTSAQLARVRITGIVDAGNASIIPPIASAGEATTYGLAMKNVASAHLDDVAITGFSEFGATFIDTVVVWNRGGAPDNRTAGFYAQRGSIDLTATDFSRTFKSMFRPEPVIGAIFVGGTEVTSTNLSVNEGAGLGVLHVDAAGRHSGIQINNNREDGVRIEQTIGFELSGTLSGNRVGGLVVLASSNVSIHDATIERTVTTPVVIHTTTVGMTIDVGDGIHLVDSLSSVEVKNVTLTDNERVGMLIQLGGGALPANALQMINVSGGGGQLGVIVQDGTAPAGWDATVMRGGATAANDAAFSGRLPHIEGIGPCDHPTPVPLSTMGIMGIAGL